MIANPTASLYNNRVQVLAVIEIASLDVLGPAWDASVSEILGRQLRHRGPFASYPFFRYRSIADGSGEGRPIDQLVTEARGLKFLHGFTTHKLKGECSRQSTSCPPTVFLPTHCRAIRSASTPMRCRRPSRPLDSDARSKA